ncbi:MULTISPECIES: transferase [unclassified Streptomyces]|uniref:transferase n=1 Tax=unclassified Streptomyces TaxID=2593676 RepID=UPI003406D1B5
MPSVHLADYTRGISRGALAATPYGDLAVYDLADFLARWPGLHAAALAHLGTQRVHPTAYIHPTAIIGDDVIVGSHVQVHEFSTVRKGSVLANGALIGFNCEVTRAFVGEGTVLGHRVGVNHTILGAGVHLSASVTVAAINMCENMRRPDREVVMRADWGLYRCGTTRFGALIGDGTQTGNNISLGPGVAVGRDCRIGSGVTLAARIVPERHAVSAPHIAQTRVHRRRVAPTAT